jgi:hypothetical protein
VFIGMALIGAFFQGNSTARGKSHLYQGLARPWPPVEVDAVSLPAS